MAMTLTLSDQVKSLVNKSANICFFQLCNWNDGFIDVLRGFYKPVDTFLCFYRKISLNRKIY